MYSLVNMKEFGTFIYDKIGFSFCSTKMESCISCAWELTQISSYSL